ncbi:Pyridoxal-phosphate dependent enzyme [Trichostrongylus colubriformis]|uniref:L-serine ammonia-lyase n=1 Tax=Trichostrongylus colubriformis TaxID=6319 RepID=A0AAN8EUA0_TRICO
MVICAEEVEKARHRFAGRIHRTPVITCESIDKVAGCKVFMKCEHLQKTGSFKARGALNAVQKMKDEGPVKGVVTHSSGNHGQGLAWAASESGLPCWVAVPRNAPPSKIDAMKCYGARLELCEATHRSREETCARLAKELNYQVVEPFNNPDVICGQGTIGAEIVEQVPDADAVFLAVGGGGMASGITAYIAEVRPDIRVYLVEPEGKELAAYLTNGEITPERDVVDTVADGIRVLKVGEYCYPILKKSCTDKVITVSDDEIRAALKLIWTRTKQRVEPSAAVPLAGLLKVSPSELGVKKAVLLLCGGNVDLDFVP